MFATIEFLGRDRDKERLQEAEQIRLGKVAAKNNAVRFKGWGVRSLLLAIFVLALAAVPALAGPVPVQTDLPAAESSHSLASCMNEAAMGVMGRDGA